MEEIFLGAYSSKWLETLTITLESMVSDRPAPEANSLHLNPKTGNRERALITNVLKTIKTNPIVIPLPARLSLQPIKKSLTGSQVFKCPKIMGVILIKPPHIGKRQEYGKLGGGGWLYRWFSRNTMNGNNTNAYHFHQWHNSYFEL